MKTSAVFILAINLLCTLCFSQTIYGVKSRSNNTGGSGEYLTPVTLYAFAEDGSSFTSIGAITNASAQICADGLAYSSSLGLWCFEPAGNSSTLRKIDTATAAVIGGGFVFTDRLIFGAAFDRHGFLWATDQNSDQLLKIDISSGNIIQQTQLTFNGISFNLNSASGDICFDSMGNAYLVDCCSLYKLNVHTGILTKIYDDVTPYSKFLVGATVSADKPATLIGFDVSISSSDNDDIFLYNLSSPAQPTYLFKYILNSYNAGRGDLATDVSADLYVGSKFDTDADGWTGAALSVSDISQIVQTIGITYDASGYISIADTDDYWTTFAAPAKFLGDKSDWLGGTISLDLINQTGGTALNGPVVFLVSGDTVLCSPFILPSGSWLNYQIALTPAGWHLQTIDGVEPDLETMHNVLANLDAMYIVGDYVSGIETTSIDNVGMVSGLSVDSDNSGFVNFVDFAMFAEQWQQELCDTTNWCDGQDFNKSGDVNYSDMQYLVINWLTEIH